uniref:Cytochrome c oxidase subunit n=1 Tax=Oryza punctata TaxID=4537 RepID=A0A0E0LNH6_ORYPU
MAAGEGKAPTLAEEHSLPPHEVHVENSSSEKSSDSTLAEVVPEKDAETPIAEDTTSVVEDKIETPEMTASSEKPEEDGSNAATEESNEAEEETVDEKPEIKIDTAPADFRFPTTNQTRHCFTRYIEYHRCVAAKGEDAPECEKFAKYYRSLCPSEWIERWNEQRENGTFPGPL